jgi:TolB protein
MLIRKWTVVALIIQCCVITPVAAEAAKPLGGNLPAGLIKAVKPAPSESSSSSKEESSDIPAVIEITRGQIKATPVAIPLFLGDSEYAAKITEVIGNDLTMCGRFDILSKQSFIQDAASVHENVRFADWRVINDQILLIGKVEHSGSKITVQFKIYDVVNGMLLKGFSLSTDEKKWRKLAHMISDAVYERVTGDAGFFDSQVVFIDEQGHGKNKKKRLCMMDIDGHNVVYLTNGSNLVLTPRFSPSTHHIAYLGFRKNSAAVYLMDVREKEAKVLGAFEGMTFAPRFSPDGSKVVMSLTKGASTALYTYNISTKETRQLTPHMLIDTSPCYSPDGAYIVFTSDRNNNGSAEKLFTMKSDGSDVKQISNGPGNHSQPVWSPRGDLIAFSKRAGGTYNLCVINTDGTEERVIDQGYLIEGAAWSPNGRYIIYTKESSDRKSQLCCADLTGHVKMPIKTPHNASDPAWSPLLSNISVKK